MDDVIVKIFQIWFTDMWLANAKLVKFSFFYFYLFIFLPKDTAANEYVTGGLSLGDQAKKLGAQAMG